jgi:iron complex transport system substrate-binding protein
MANQPTAGGCYAARSSTDERLFVYGALVIALLSSACDVSTARTSNMRARAPQRIVSLLPTATDVILALGAECSISARTNFDTDPRLASVVSLGASIRPTIEAVLAHRPDLVIAETDHDGRTLAAQLRRTGIRVYTPGLERLADLEVIITELGDILGRRTRADSLVREIRSGLAALEREHATRARPTALYVVWPDPAITSGKGTFVDDVIRAAGARNVFDDVQGGWPRISIEQIRSRDPDYLIIPKSPGRQSLVNHVRSLPGWRDLSAVRNGRVIVVDNDLFTRPHPRVVEAARILSRAIHQGVE